MSGHGSQVVTERAFDALIIDLDGVVYTGALPIEGAAEGISSAREDGLKILFMTNNAAKKPADVVAHLESVGVAATPDEVLTSSQVAAAYVVSELGDDIEQGRVLAVGGPGVSYALNEVGVSPMLPSQIASDGPSQPFVAVVQGYGPELRVTDLHEAGLAVNAGALWVATNTDATLPTPRGMVPGNGALVAAVAHGTGATPVVVGKPQPFAYEMALKRLGLPAERVLAIGDRLDTDIDGAIAANVPAALVLTGVNTAADAQARPSQDQPTLIAAGIPELRATWLGKESVSG